MQEKWYPVEKSSRRESPSLRLRCQYQSVEILPLRDYENLLYFLKDEYKTLARLLEPTIGVKVGNFAAIKHKGSMTKSCHFRSKRSLHLL